MTTREQRIEKYHADRSVYQAVPKCESFLVQRKIANFVPL